MGRTARIRLAGLKRRVQATWKEFGVGWRKNSGGAVTKVSESLGRNLFGRFYLAGKMRDHVRTWSIVIAMRGKRKRELINNNCTDFKGKSQYGRIDVDKRPR